MIVSVFDIGEEDMMAKSMRLKRQLEETLGRNDVDWLSQYRKYLDQKRIRAEDDDGWPSPEAFSQFNVRKFIQERLASDEVEG